jgi:hypothetical protein
MFCFRNRPALYLLSEFKKKNPHFTIKLSNEGQELSPLREGKSICTLAEGRVQIRGVCPARVLFF